MTARASEGTTMIHCSTVKMPEQPAICDKLTIQWQNLTPSSQFHIFLTHLHQGKSVSGTCEIMCFQKVGAEVMVREYVNFVAG